MLFDRFSVNFHDTIKTPNWFKYYGGWTCGEEPTPSMAHGLASEFITHSRRAVVYRHLTPIDRAGHIPRISRQLLRASQPAPMTSADVIILTLIIIICHKLSWAMTSMCVLYENTDRASINKLLSLPAEDIGTCSLCAMMSVRGEHSNTLQRSE